MKTNIISIIAIAMAIKATITITAIFTIATTAITTTKQQWSQ